MGQISYLRSVTAPSSKLYLRGITGPYAYISGVNGGSANVIRKGASFTVSGAGFGASQGTGTLQVLGLSGYITCTITSWNDTTIVATAPASGIMFTPTTTVRVTPQVLGAFSLTGVIYAPPAGYVFERLTTTTIPLYSMAYGITGLSIGDEIYLNGTSTRSGGSETASVSFVGSGDGVINLTGVTVDGDYPVTGINIRDLTDGTDSSNGPITITIDSTAPSGFDFTINQSTIDSTNQSATSFTFSGAEINATYNLSITSSNGGTLVTGFGTITSATQSITGINVSGLPDGTLTYTVILTDTVGNTSNPVSHTVLKDTLIGAVPNAFSFTDQIDVPLATVITSNSVQITGLTTSSAISIVGGEYSINGSPWSTVASTITNGQNVQVRGISSSNFSITTGVTLTIGGVSDTFSFTTIVADSVPNAFSFTPAINVTPNSTNVTSNTIVISGINTTASVSITGGSYSIGTTPGTFTTATGTITNGQSITVRGNASSSNATTTTVTLTIGGVVGTFNITTIAASVSINLYNTVNGINTPIANTNIDWFISQTWGGPILANGTTATNSIGNLLLTNLPANTGAGWVYVKLSSNPIYASAYPVTFF